MILLIDNYDSFTYNIAQALGVLGRSLEVRRNDAIGLQEIQDLAPEAIFISPGPGRPEDSGITCAAIERFAGRMPIMGVCLGHQALAEVFGAQVVRANRPVHGKISQVFHDGKGIYSGLRNPFAAARYHSLIVPEASVRPPLSVSAYTSEGEVMGLRSSELMLEGVQFHPESIATHQGMMIFTNFLDLYLGRARTAAAQAGS
ncbi:MAG: aminodeoxychorismate/anthranilate synthase component II [Desulfarculus sp.]|nr:MAG: aminodeoxychorismate/anthranilate synthase component II [Desulfarculus sp.]